MDIVDTLRHNARIVAKELSGEEREQALMERLRQIYKAQGIEVPDHILRDGVAALEDQRFAYTPPKKGFSTSLAKLYVTRGKWGTPVFFVAGLTVFLFAVYQFAGVQPRAAAERRAEIGLTQTFPSELDRLQAEALTVAASEDIRQQVVNIVSDGEAAIADGDRMRAAAAVDALGALNKALRQAYDIRVVSRPGEYSGVFRIPDDVPDARNYYLIVEAVSSDGKVLDVRITSEEDQSTKVTDIWGVRVPKAEFDRVAADKQDDQIIQSAVIGRKARGVLQPDYDINGVGGAILEW